MAVRKVRTIPATLNRFSQQPTDGITKRKVAAYARVSTDSEEQQTSYTTQVNFYTQHIQSRDDWEFVNVYTDEGISGTNTKRREGFNRMIQDALDDKIDLIITKSVSRFARNTVDSLSTIRKLKENGVEVYFEKENIWTFDSKGELLITIMSSLAQEESRSISENVTWGKRKLMAEGKFTLPYSNFLGYDKGPNGEPVINEQEAAVVQKIFGLYLSGYSFARIAQNLTGEGIPTPAMKTKWSISTVKSILTNEKYKGDALLQKKFTVDFLKKKLKQNEGEVPQYYVEGSHPAIIDPEVFDLVQDLMKERSGNTGAYSSSPFSKKIICKDCGHIYKAKTWHSNNEKYKKKVWICSHKYKGDKKCTTPKLEDKQLEEGFIFALNQLIKKRPSIMEHAIEALETVFDTSPLEGKLEEAGKILEEMTARIERSIRHNAIFSQNQDEYLAAQEALEKDYRKAEKEYNSLVQQIDDLNKRKAKTQLFLRNLGYEQNVVTEFSAVSWYRLIDFVEIDSSGTLTYVFMDGTKIEFSSEKS